MKKTGILLVVIAMFCFLFVTESAFSSQRGRTSRESRSWNAGTQYGKMYSTKTVETIDGEVVSVEKFAPMKGMSQGFYLTLKTEKETIPVHLGPESYIENQKVKFEPKDKLKVKGSRITFDEKPAIIAAEVKKGDEVLAYLQAMRDSNLEKADAALAALLKRRAEARKFAEQLSADQIPPAELAKVPSAVYQGFLKNLLSQL